MFGQKAPYIALADAFLKHSTSEPAKKAANFHLMRLHGIGDLEQSLWPPLEAHTTNNETTDIPTGGEAVERGGEHIPQHMQIRHFPSLPSIRASYGVAAPTTMKAAIAIFNAHTTGSIHVILLQTLSGREWPFLSDTISKLLPSPGTIAGPTLAMAIDVSRIDWNEKARDLLRRLATEQRTLLRHQRVPPDFAMHLSPEDQKVLQLATRQVFHFQPLGMSERNYSTSTDPTMRLLLDVNFKVNRLLGSGFVWECGFNDPEHWRCRV